MFDLIDELFFQPVWVGIYVEDISRTTGMLITGIGFFLAMRDLNQVHEQLSLELKTDDLTKVANRRYFYQYLKSNSSDNYSILIIDIDHFKRINDDFGHDVGDQVLVEFAMRCNEQLNTDSVFARIGGEEFAVYYATDNRIKVAQLSQQLLNTAQQIKIAAQRSVTVSIGVAIKSHDTLATDVIKRADQALYKAKNEGRDRVVISDDNIQTANHA
ncbi:GGDEF domain-containing protein [Pseudoalteromonas mariniglutinosa]|uniref:GGDEF domain-containing protein n=1 Tax=Pseudoalteromonas mariniglutinosa TaxID=206042 RepID=UPI003850CD97